MSTTVETLELMKSLGIKVRVKGDNDLNYMGYISDVMSYVSSIKLYGELIPYWFHNHGVATITPVDKKWQRIVETPLWRLMYD